MLEKRLAKSKWIAGPLTTIADIALYPYTRWMDEIGFFPQDWSAINGWLGRFEQLPDFLPPYEEGASEIVEFLDYFRALPI